MEKLFLIALAIIVLSSSVQCSVISSNNGVINCNGIICPVNSASCIVSEKTFGNAMFFKLIILCSDASGISTHYEEKELPNPLPGTVINNVSSYGGNTLSEEDRKELEAKLEAMAKQQQEYWKKWTLDFNANMAKQFPPGFPFN